MGNIFGCLWRQRGRRGHPPPMQQPEILPARYVFEADSPCLPQHTNPSNANPQYYPQYPRYCPPPPQAVSVPLPVHYYHRRHHNPSRVGGTYPCGPLVAHPPPIDRQKAVLIRNDVNVKKDTLMIDADEENPGKFLVSFTFDAAVDGSITIAFFAKEGDNCGLIPMKAEILPPVTVQFQEGLGQKFQQPSGTGINFSKFEEKEFLIEGETEVFPLAVKAETHSSKEGAPFGNPVPESMKKSQITLVEFEKNKIEYKARVVKQILWVNGMRYELQDIYGIGNSLEGDVDGDDAGKECVICLSETRDTTVLPCRHMCMCSGCAKRLRFQTDKCPVCRHPVNRLLEMNVHDIPS